MLKKINAVNFNYELYGTGSPIIFIAPYTGNINHWRTIADFFSSKGHQVLIFDNQGVGDTIDDNKALSAENMACNIHQLYKSLGLKNPIIIGFAFGSCIAQVIAHKYPEDVSYLILVGSVLKFNKAAQANCERLCKLREIGSDAAFAESAELIYDTCFSSSYKQLHSKADIVEFFTPILKTSQDKIGQRRQVEALKKFDSSLWAQEISIPTFVITPEEEQYALPSEGKALADAIMSSGTTVQFFIIKNCGHGVFIEMPEELKNILSSIVGNYRFS